MLKREYLPGQVTVFLLLLCCMIITVGQFFSSPINCIVHKELVPQVGIIVGKNSSRRTFGVVDTGSKWKNSSIIKVLIILFGLWEVVNL